MDVKKNTQTKNNHSRSPDTFGESEGEQVGQLTAGHTGRWLITTQGSRHIWDLDAMTYTRLPSETSKSGAMDHDRAPVRINRVIWWPTVGERSWLWFDDPQEPMFVEHYRISSTVVCIEKFPTEPGEACS